MIPAFFIESSTGLARLSESNLLPVSLFLSIQNSSSTARLEPRVEEEETRENSLSKSLLHSLPEEFVPIVPVMSLSSKQEPSQGVCANEDKVMRHHLQN